MGKKLINKKLMTLTIIIISLLAISAVSAEENVTSDVVSVNQDNIIITDYDNQPNPDNENVVLKTFTDLNNTINGNQDNNIYLDENYVFEPGTDDNFKDGIVISRSLTI